MKFLSQYWATLLHPQNRPELTGNILLFSLLVSYILLSIPGGIVSNSQSSDEPVFQKSLTHYSLN